VRRSFPSSPHRLGLRCCWHNPQRDLEVGDLGYMTAVGQEVQELGRLVGWLVLQFVGMGDM
jgi:hypothetical protein